MLLTMDTGCVCSLTANAKRPQTSINFDILYNLRYKSSVLSGLSVKFARELISRSLPHSVLTSCLLQVVVVCASEYLGHNEEESCNSHIRSIFVNCWLRCPYGRRCQSNMLTELTMTGTAQRNHVLMLAYRVNMYPIQNCLSRQKIAIIFIFYQLWT